VSRLRDYRKSLGLTQREVGYMLGVRQSTVAMWETGANKVNVDALKKLASLYSCKVDDLLEADYGSM